MKQLFKELWSHKAPVLILLSCLLLEAAVTGLMPHSQGWLYDILGSKQGPFWWALIYVCSCRATYEVLQSFKSYLVLKVSLLCRSSRTERVFKEGLKEPSNTPQRIQEDIKLSYINRIAVIAEYLVSGIILVQLTIMNLGVPLLLVASFAYGIISVWVAMRFNPKLTQAEITEQAKEADYRTGLVNVLNPLGLPGANKASLWAARIRLNYNLFTRVQVALVIAIPYIVLGPLVLSGAITLGALVAHSVTFGLIVVNSSILLSMYLVWIKGTASEIRVKEIEK